MATNRLVELEAAIKELPGVLGCVIVTHADGSASEIQAFTSRGTDRQATEAAILAEVSQRKLEGALRQVFVFELEAETGDRDELQQAADAAGVAEDESPMAAELSELARQPIDALTTPLMERPPLRRVRLTSSPSSVEAEVALGLARDEAVGQASGERTTHSLRVLARATLDAVHHLVDIVDFTLIGASLVQVSGEEAVLVVLRVGSGPETLGAALVRNGPVTEAAVRATLDGVNRRLVRG